MYALIPTPMLPLWRRRLAVMRQLLVEAVQRLDELQQFGVPSVTAHYFAWFGPVEAELYATDITLQQMRYRLRLVRQYRNRQAPIDDVAIRAATAKKFAYAKAEIAARQKQIRDAEAYLQLPLLSDADTASMNRLYKLLIRRLHPDLHPNQSPEEARAFLLAVDAYARGEVALLQLLVDMYGQNADEQPQADALAALLARLRRQYLAVLAEHDEILATWPMTIRHELASAPWRDAHKQALEAELAQLCCAVAAACVAYGVVSGELEVADGKS